MITRPATSRPRRPDAIGTQERPSLRREARCLCGLLASIWFVSLITAPSNVIELALAQFHHSLLVLRKDRSFHKRPLEDAGLEGRAPQTSTAQICSDKPHALEK